MSGHEQGMDGPTTYADQIHDYPDIEQEKDIYEPTLRTNADQVTKDMDVGDEIEKGDPYVQPADAPQRVPHSKSAETVAPGDEEAPESEQTRIERLGRERPAKFKSFGAELAFCYSVIASQFMSVCFVQVRLSKGDN